MATDDLLNEAEFAALKKAAAGPKPAAAASRLVTPSEVIQELDLKDLELPADEGPGLDSVCERFARGFGETLMRFYRTEIEIEFESTQTMIFAEFRASLEMPTSINELKIAPLTGSALMILDWRLVFTTVDLYFGGTGEHPETPSGVDMVATEQRITQSFVDITLNDLRSAWEQQLPVEIERTGFQSDPSTAAFRDIADTDAMEIASFKLTFPSGGGSLLIAISQLTLDHVSTASANSDQDKVAASQTFQRALFQNLQDTEIEIRSTLLETKIPLQRLLSLKPGEILPVTVPDSVVVTAENIPLFHGPCGEADGQLAVRVAAWVEEQH